MDARRVAEAIKKRETNKTCIVTPVFVPESSELMPLCGRPRGKRCCCRVVGCNMCQLWYSQVSLFNFPREPERLKKWLQLVGREDLEPRNNLDFVCEIHFEKKYITEHAFNKHLNRFCYPTLNLPTAKQIEARKSQLVEKKPLYLNRCNQTEVSFMENKRKLKLKKPEIEEEVLERQELHDLCGIFLPKRLAGEIRILAMPTLIINEKTKLYPALSEIIKNSKHK